MWDVFSSVKIIFNWSSLEIISIPIPNAAFFCVFLRCDNYSTIVGWIMLANLIRYDFPRAKLLRCAFDGSIIVVRLIFTSFHFLWRKENRGNEVIRVVNYQFSINHICFRQLFGRKYCELFFSSILSNCFLFRHNKLCKWWWKKLFWAFRKARTSFHFLTIPLHEDNEWGGKIFSQKLPWNLKKVIIIASHWKWIPLQIFTLHFKSIEKLSVHKMTT